MAWSAISPDRRTYRGAIRCADGLIKARRQWDGVPEMWVTPCAPARVRKSPGDSPALDSTIDAPPRSAGEKICRPPYRRSWEEGDDTAGGDRGPATGTRTVETER